MKPIACGAATALATILAILPAMNPAFAAEPRRGGTLTMGRPEEPLSFDPFKPTDNGSVFAIAQVCEPLILADKDGTGLEPGLASSWNISADGLTYVFTLREGVVFSDGKPLTADDVVFSLTKQMDPTSSFGFALEPVNSITKVDDGHVKIELKQPYSPILSTLSLFATSIVEKAAYEAGPEAFATAPVCTGPFTVENYHRGSDVQLAANPHYWGKGADGKPLPYLDKIIMKYMPDGNSRVLGLQKGDLDVAEQIPLSQASAVKATDGLVLEVAPTYALDFVYLNHAKKPLDDKRIRLALNYATNHEAIMKAVYFGYGEIPNSFMPKVNFWSSKVERIPYDLKKAEELVKEANYDGTPIELIVSSGNSAARQTATIQQAAWTKIGLKVNIVQYEGATASAKLHKGDYQARVGLITSDINDSDELATMQADYHGSTNAWFSWYKNDEVVKLLDQARAERDDSKRAALYAQIQDVVYHDGYNVPLNFVPFVNGYKSNVQDWRNIAIGWWWMKTVWLAN